MIRPNHLKIIGWNQFRNSMRGGAGIIFICFALFIGLGVSNCAIGKSEDFARSQEKGSGLFGRTVSDPEQRREMVEKMVTEGTREIVTLLATDGDEDYRKLGGERPPQIVGFQVLLFFFVPVLVAFGAFNTFSGDIGNRGLRYQLLRTERSNLFFGRLIGTWGLITIVFGMVILITAIYIALMAKYLSFGDSVVPLLWTWLAASVLAVPYTAFCCWLSASIDSPFGSLAASIGLIVAVPFIIYLFSKTEARIEYAQYATPWGFRNMMLYDSAVTKLIGIAAMLGFGALFTFLGQRTFNRRDL